MRKHFFGDEFFRKVFVMAIGTQEICRIGWLHENLAYRMRDWTC